MGDKESNAGFVALHNPFGLFVVIASFLFLTAVIVAGGAFFRVAQQRDRENRERLRKELEAKKNDRA